MLRRETGKALSLVFDLLQTNKANATLKTDTHIITPKRIAAVSQRRRKFERVSSKGKNPGPSCSKGG